MAEAYEVARYLPGYIYIGSDGGGRGLFLRSSPGGSPVFICGHGALAVEELRVVAPSLEAWFDAECDLGDPPQASHPAAVDVVVAKAPQGGVSALRQACASLGLAIPVLALRDLLRNAPATLARRLPFFPTVLRVAKLNRGDVYLEIYDHDDPEHRTPL